MMSDPGGLAVVSLLLPAISFLILAVVAPLRRLGRPAAYTSILFAAGALVAAFFSWRGHAGGQITKQVWDGLPSDGTSLAAIGILADADSTLMLILVTLVMSRCTPSQPASRRAAGGAQSDVALAAQKTYVSPGDLDEYYMFSSGGHSGQVYVYGVPSMRHLSTIPVFTPYPATGYGFDDDSKKMRGELTWGDAHHPALSETKGDYDGRWLFIN